MEGGWYRWVEVGSMGRQKAGQPESTIDPSRYNPTHIVDNGNRLSLLSLNPGRAANNNEIYSNLFQSSVRHQSIEHSSQSTYVEPI